MERQVSRGEALLIGGGVSLAFTLILTFGSYRAKYNFAVYALFGAAMFLAFLLLMLDGRLRTPKRLLAASALLVGAFAIRMCFIDARSGDYNSFLQHWAEFFRINGGFAALKHSVGDYNLPYLYIMALISYVPVDDLYMIKFVSTVFDVLLAFYAMRLCGLITSDGKASFGVFFGVLLLPTVFLNSGWWAQCDSIYACFAVAALYYGLADRPIAALLMGALSFAFKLQAIFILPIFAVLLMCGKMKWRYIPLFAVFYALMALPAIIAGRPPLDALLIYANQVGEYSSHITLNAPTLAVTMNSITTTSTHSTLLILIAFLFLSSLLLVALVRRKSLGNREITLFAMAMAVGIPFLLPSMHERYFYIAEVLAMVCAFGGIAYFALPALVEAASMICYDAYITGYYRFRLGLAAWLMAGGLLLALYSLYRALKPGSAAAVVPSAADAAAPSPDSAPPLAGSEDGE